MNTSGPYTIRAFATTDTAPGCDYDTQRDTLADARKAARYCLTQGFADGCEMAAPFVRSTVEDAAGVCVADYTAKPLAAHVAAARKLARIAYLGLYSDPEGLRPLRWNNTRAVPGGIELRDAYGTGADAWHPLTAAMRLADCNARPVVNPLAP